MAGYLTRASPPLAEEARRIIAHKEPLSYLALQYISEVERTGTVFEEIEAFLDDTTVVPLPQPIDSSGEDRTAATSYAWMPRTVSQVAATELGDLYLKYFKSAGSYRSWRASVDADPVLRWKYRPIITDDDLRSLLANRIEFARILCLSHRWVEFEGGGHYELKITDNGTALLERLTHEKVSYKHDLREALAIRLLRQVLEGVPLPELIDAIRINPTAEPPNWSSDRKDKYAQDYFGAAVIQAKQEAFVGYPDKKAVWDLLEQHRREAKVCWPYKAYLCSLMFSVDFERTDKLARELLVSAPAPKDTSELFEREEMLEAMLKDHFSACRQLIKDLYFVSWPQKVNGATDLTGTINLRIIGEGGDRQRLWKEIQQDPRDQESEKRNK